MTLEAALIVIVVIAFGMMCWNDYYWKRDFEKSLRAMKVTFDLHTHDYDTVKQGNMTFTNETTQPEPNFGNLDTIKEAIQKGR